MTKEYKTITEISGPLIFVEKTEPVGYNELVEIRTGGELKRGQVLDSSDEIVVVQVFEGTGGLSKESAVSFTGDVIKMPLSPAIVGRVLSGSGRPRDGGPEIVPDVSRDIAGAAINPASREKPVLSSRRASPPLMAPTPWCAARSCPSSLVPVCLTMMWLCRSPDRPRPWARLSPSLSSSVLWA